MRETVLRGFPLVSVECVSGLRWPVNFHLPVLCHAVTQIKIDQALVGHPGIGRMRLK